MQPEDAIETTGPDLLEIMAELTAGGRLLVIGEMGTGKSTLVTAMADEAWRLGLSCTVVHADPGQPLFGPPGAAARGRRVDGKWQLEAIAGLGSLDAVRFRQPLAGAVRRLIRGVKGPVILDAPGVSRGLLSAELLCALATSCEVASAVLLVRPGGREDVRSPLEAEGVRVRVHHAHDAATPGSREHRSHRRTAAWAAHLEDATVQTLHVTGLPLVGTPPIAPEDWVGRQVVLLDRRGDTVALAEALRCDGQRLTARCIPIAPDTIAGLAVRDARRLPGGELRTSRPALSTAETEAVAARGTEGTGTHGLSLPPPVRRCDAQAVLLGGLFGDPLLHIRLARELRSVLVDLGACEQVPSRIVHQTDLVLLTHSHMDHLAGFPWLLRRRMGLTRPCTIIGPRATADRIAAHLDAYTWDRVGDEGPAFLVGEVDGAQLRWTELRAGQRAQPRGVTEATDGVVHREAGFLVRAAVLDHGIDVLAFRYEEADRLRLIEDRVRERGLAPGPWVGEVRRSILGGAPDDIVRIPGGLERPAGELAEALFEREPGQVIVYATDLADSPGNRAALTDLARGAHILLCEARFVDSDADRARETSHLTARACGEIARDAGVELLVPFHFSVRYSEKREAVYDEVAAIFPRIQRARA